VPYSADEGKDWILDHVRALDPPPATVLDVGPGAGAYARLLRPCLPPGARLDAVEIYEPYVDRFGLASLYDTVTVGDIRDFDWPEDYDLVVLGDVLEHLTFGDAMRVWKVARRHADHLIVSLPTSERWWHQEPENGNPYERHHFAWTYRLFRSMPGVVDSQHGQDVSVYLAKGVQTHVPRRRARAVS
jgi:predicted TPR repeat methyltransferase